MAGKPKCDGTIAGQKMKDDKYKNLKTFLGDQIKFIEDYLQVGQQLRINFGKGNHHNKLIEIRAVVDKELVVYRYYRNFKYIYKMENIYYFSLLKDDGHLTKVGNHGRDKNRMG